MGREAVRMCNCHRALEALQPRVLLSADSLLPILPSDVTQFQISAVWFQSFEGRTSEGGFLSALDAGGGIAKVDWKGQTIDVRKDQWIIQFTGDALQDVTSVTGTADLLTGGAVDFEIVRGLGMAGQVLLQTPGADFDSVQQWLSQNGNIACFEPNAILTSLAIPNDSSFSQLWGLHNTGQSGGTADADIDGPEAWELTTGSSEVILAIIDTGIDYEHLDLGDNVWRNPGEIAGDGIDNDGNGYVDDVYGWDFVGNDNDPMDDNGHGTHVAGTIGAVGNNGTGVAGINWNVQLMALKFLDDTGSGSTSDAVEAINYATLMKRDYGVNVVASNNSWGGGGYSSSLRDAIAAAGNEGILFVAAAGNGGTDGVGDNNDEYPHYPSNYDLDNIISVAATDRNDRLASFSNYGAASVDLAAPGVSIYSTLPDGYGWYSGTSMAAPHVTGVVGLLASLSPGATAGEIKSAILAGADPISGMTGLSVTGGRLNAYGALQVMGVAGPRVYSISPASTSAPVSTITVRFTEDIFPGSVVPANFLLRDNGPDDIFETPDDRAFSFSSSDLTQPQGDQVQIELGAMLGPEEYRLTLLGTGSNPIRDNEDAPLNGGIDEVYFFEIVSAEGPYEPNDSVSEATDAGLVGAGTVSISAHIGDGFHGNTDIDLFALEVVGAATITADIDANQIGTGLDPVLRLFDAGGNELAMNDDTHGLDSFISYAGAGAGTYYVGVSGYNNFYYDPNAPGSASAGSTGDYVLKLILDAELLPGEIHGEVWNDRNGSGVRDEGETALESWPVFVDFNRNGQADDATVSTVHSLDVPDIIWDHIPLASDLVVSGIDGMLTDVNVTLDIMHTWDRDLEAYLVSPAGTRVELFTRVGGRGDNFSNTTLDDEATIPITMGSPPFAGSYRPEGLLADFDGEDPNGTWTLEIYDVSDWDFGILFDWSVTLATGEPTTQTGVNGEYEFTGLRTGSYRIVQVPPAGWELTAPAEGFHELTLSDGQIIEGVDFGARLIPPAVLNAVINQGSQQRSTIRTLAIQFDQDVSANLDAGDLTIFNDSLNVQVDTSAAKVSFDGETFTAKWDLSDVAFADAYYTATLSAEGIAPLGVLSASASDFASQFHRLAGDADGNAVVDVGDLGVVSGSYGNTGDNIAGDLDADGIVNIGDLGVLGANYGNELGPRGAISAMTSGDAGAPAAATSPQTDISTGGEAAAYDSSRLSRNQPPLGVLAAEPDQVSVSSVAGATASVSMSEPLSAQEGVRAEAAGAATQTAIDSGDRAAGPRVDLDEALIDILALSRMTGPMAA